MRASLLVVLAGIVPADATLIPIATFDGAEGTTLPWTPVNDPVMGGQSTSSFQVDGEQHRGIWSGEVKIVPFLKAPGFCTLQAPGLRKPAIPFPDLTGTVGVVAQLAQTLPGGLTGFTMTVKTKSMSPEMAYTANISGDVTKMDYHSIPWSSFVCTLRGQRVPSCPALETRLDEVSGVGISTVFPGATGPFRVEIESISADTGSKPRDVIELASFNGKETQHLWHSENDPVMGGQSSSEFHAEESFGDYSGVCRIVPKLQAPGFTIALTESPLLARFPDVSSMDGLLLTVRRAGGSISSFKAAFCDSHINFFRCQFQTFKASFEVQAVSADFQEIFLPWSAFSDKWDAATGKHTEERPPTSSSLASITQLQIWTEGVEGDFHLQIKSVAAATAPRAGAGGLPRTPQAPTTELIFV